MDRLLSAQDLAQVAHHGLDEKRVRRQLALLREAPLRIALARPATVGDGIVRLADERRGRLLELYDEAAARGRFAKLVPASGAATRMFRSLVAVHRGEATPDDERACRRWLDNLERFPFHEELVRAAAGRDAGALLAALLEDEGLGYLRHPKGLVPFHRYAEGNRTPFEEHLVEAALHLRAGEGRCRVHFTVLERHEALFRDFWRDLRPALEERLATRFDVELSFQAPSTDTIAADLDGRPFRGAGGRLVFRPGGHGALLGNLGRLDADLVFIKNVDNVVRDGRREVVVEWKKLLGGHLLAVERRIVDLLERAGDDAGWRSDARAFLVEELGLEEADVPSSAPDLRRRLDRPLRVCGVVPVTGEPGGGPFWVRDAHGGRSLQIVESSQIDTADEAQAAILKRSTHFNPVDLVCRLRDHRGRPYDLARYVDDDAVVVTRKSHAGQPLLAIEHPGLWNGGMARWNTIFVEVPAATFAPVKTVLDLLRPEHQP